MVHHAQHTLTVAVHDLQLAAYVRTDPFVAQYILYRPDDERQRGTQLMADVRKETQFDIRHFLLNLYLAAQTVIQAHDVDDQSDDGQHAAYIEHECPPPQPPGTQHEDGQPFLVVHFASFAVGRANMEGIVAVTEVVIGHAAHILGIVPVVIDAVQLVVIDDLICADIVHSCVFDGDVRAVFDRDGITLKLHILRLDARDAHRRHGGGSPDTVGRESAVSVRIAE